MSWVLLNDVATFIRRFVVVSDQQADTLAIWTGHTHAVGAAETTPYLAITSPEKRSGKTRLLEVLELVANAALPTANISDAALFRSISPEAPPSLLLDEVDAIFKAREREDLRGLLNAGFRRGAVVRRMGGPRNTKLETFEVFCPKAFAGIGNCLPDTILDRSISIRLQRKTRAEPVERFRRRRVVPKADELRDRLADWLEPQVDDLHAAEPELPEELDDRAQDMWEPLLALADLAGGDWPERAIRAALELSGSGAREDESLTALLLHDIEGYFGSGDHDRVRTADLLDHLHAIEESPWGEWFGKPLSAHGLSKLLRPYRIKTMPVWLEGKTGRGYKAEQFAEAFARVLSDRTARSDRSESPSQEAPIAPIAPIASHAGEPDTANGAGRLLSDEEITELGLLSLDEVRHRAEAGGLPFGGLCSPSPSRCHVCQSESGLEPGKAGDGRWWCSDFEACNERARHRFRKGPRP